MEQRSQELDRKIQETKDLMTRGNSYTNFSCFYENEHIETCEKSLSILNSFQYDKDGKAINFEDIINKGVENSLGGSSCTFQAYAVLQRIVPLLNENKITSLVGKIAEVILPWMKANQIIVISAHPQESEMVIVHPADPQTQSLKPTSSPFVVHWYPLAESMMLFYLLEVAQHIGSNGKNKQHFMAMIFSLKALEQRLIQGKRE